MFFGALAQVHPGLDPHDGDGFVIITAASDQGMVISTVMIAPNDGLKIAEE